MTAIYLSDWKLLLKRLKLQYLAVNHPDFLRMSGGDKMKIKPYSDSTANELTRAIVDFFIHAGGDANRINTQGQMRKINGKMKWTKGATRKGTADVKAIWKGRAIDVEVKIGKDSMSDAQHKERQRIEKAGGIYIVAKSFPDFLIAFATCFPNDYAAITNNCKAVA